MENFTFYSPTFFAFGKDTENDAGKYVKRFGGSKVLIHYGGGSVIDSSDIPKLVEALCYGDGRTGSISGFVTLDTDDCTKIYQMMVK